MGGMPGQMTRYTFLCMYSCKQEVINDIFLSGLFANIDSQNLELRYLSVFSSKQSKKELRYLSIKVIFFFFQSGWLWDGRQTTHSGFKSDLLKRSSPNQSFKITLTQQEYVRPSLHCIPIPGKFLQPFCNKNNPNEPLSPQFPLSQRRKRRVLFTQAQVDAFYPLYLIPGTLHRIS